MGLHASGLVSDFQDEVPKLWLRVRLEASSGLDSHARSFAGLRLSSVWKNASLRVPPITSYEPIESTAIITHHFTVSGSVR